MKFTSMLVPVAAVFVASVSSVPLSRRDVDPNLIPDLGFQAGKNPTGTGDCDGAVKGANGQPIKIPCACPPDRNTFVQALNANVAAGHAVKNPSVSVAFPTDNSKASQLSRINTALVTLQNLNGPGVGCPASSSTLVAQQAAINAQPGRKRAAAATPAQVAQLAPNLGFSSGVNPTGTGDCDGAVNGADGKPIKIPCACPPDQATFIQHLTGDVEAGHAVNNPSVPVSFPTDNSPASQLARVNTALVTLQNLNGPGQGCPAVSSTLSAQQKALQAQV